MAPINLSTVEECWSDLTIFAYVPPIDPSTYESHVSMTALSSSDVVTIDATKDDDEEISDKKMVHSYKIMYEKLVEIVNQNRGLFKQISQLCIDKNELVNVLKNEKEEYLNKLEYIKKTMRMMNYGTTTLNHILLIGKTTKDHEGLGFNRESSKTKSHAPTNAIQTSITHYQNGSRKHRSSKTQNLICYYCKKLGHIQRDCSHFLMHQKVRQQK